VTAPSTTSAEISLNAFNGATVDLKTDIVNAYLATPMAQQTNYVRNYHHTTSGYQDYQNISFRWSDLGQNSSYTAYFADNADFDNAFIVTTTAKELSKKVGIFVPGKTYYWFVAGNDTGECSAVDTFTALDAPARYITAGAVTNMRDEGGYTTVDGKTVNYGLVYRGAALDEEHSHVDAMARSVFKYLGIKSEIELRGGIIHRRTGWDDGNYNVNYINATGYSPILNLDADQKAQYKATFEAMADRSNYPFYFHCSAGADRTGTFGYLLNGLLGVPFETLRADYELTSFSEVGRRTADEWTDGDSFDLMHTTLMAQYGDGSGDVSAAIENFLMQHVGVDKATLDAIKVIMLESDPLDLDCSGTIDAADVLLLKEAILADSTAAKFDINGDGVVDVRDLVRFKKYLAG
ncbi:MAG: tyrosine-protein phosphatase, partial [Clostridia bacterium]|nr:tyrosine-protein phosphatase [Clostridia bacterium]